MEVYTTLTIGDGLVTQVPAFLISVAAGLIVTRTSTKSDLPADVVAQMPSLSAGARPGFGLSVRHGV